MTSVCPASLVSVTRLTAALTFLTFVTLCHLDVSSGKSLHRPGSPWQSDRNILKRNSWWSKKSVDSAPRYPQYKELRDSPYTEDYEDLPEEDAEPKLLSSYECYTDSCFPDFLLCVSRADDVSRLARCNRLHRLCAGRCLVVSPDDVDDL